MKLEESERKEHGAEYVIGMALAHKKDNGSRRKGLVRAIQKVIDFVCGEGLPPGQSGLYFVQDLETLKKVVRRLRYIERNYGNSKVNQTYNKAFFDLPTFYKEVAGDYYFDGHIHVGTAMTYPLLTPIVNGCMVPPDSFAVAIGSPDEAPKA
jgi:hypothetical protein